MRISLVIPVYNEAERIAECLQSVAGQQLAPFEVIVVDNNSTDGTAAIAQNFPFVRLVRESRQGVVYARDRGFSLASGDVIARIDADTIIAPDWLETITMLFEDQQLGAVTGRVSYRDIGASKIVSRVDLFWRRRMARLVGPEVALQGANMAIRRQAWLNIQSDVCHKRGQHEDFDLAIHTNWSGSAVRFDDRLHASVCYRQANYDFRAFCQYVLICPQTYAAHGLKSGRKMYQIVAFVILMYPIVCLLSRGYSKELRRFSFGQLFTTALPPRVNPATYVD